MREPVGSGLYEGSAAEAPVLSGLDGDRRASRTPMGRADGQSAPAMSPAT